MRRTFAFLSGVVALGLSACSDATAPSPAELSRAEAEQLAADMEQLASYMSGPSFPSFSLGTGGEASVSDPTTISNSFSFTRACPQGGQVTIAGTVTGSADRVALSFSTVSTATKTEVNCAFQTRNGVLTLNGNPNLVMRSSTSIVAGRPVGLQTSSQKGGFTWSRSTGGSGSCVIDVTSSLDPATRTMTVTGNFCGHAINVTRVLERHP